MKHSYFNKLIDRYLAGELCDEDQASFEAHMLVCKPCREKLVLSQAIVDALPNAMDKPPLPLPALGFWPNIIDRFKENLSSAPFYKPVAVAVIFSLLLGFGLGFGIHQIIPKAKPPLYRSFINNLKMGEKKDTYTKEQGNIAFWKKTYQQLDSEDPRSKMAYTVYARLLQVADPSEGGLPKLVIFENTSTAENLARALPDGHIVLFDGVIEKCQSLLKPPAHKAGLAFILGHELAHHYNGDFWGHRLTQAKDLPPHLHQHLKDLVTGQETAEYIRTQELKADTRGVLTASLAGYDVSLLLEEDGFITQWAKATCLAGNKWHPKPEERQEAIKAILSQVQKEAHSFYLGVRLAQIRRYAEAIEALAHFSRYYPSREVFTNLAISYHLWALKEGGHSQDSKEAPYKRALTPDPDTRTAQFTLMGPGGISKEDGYHKRQMLLNQALANYRRALNADPHYPPVWHNLACCYADLGANFDLALGYATQAILLNPAYSQAYNTRGTLYLKKGMMDKAYKDFHKAALQRDYSDPYYNLAYLAKKKGDSDQYLDNLKIYRTLDPDSAWANEALSWAEELGLEKPDDAIEGIQNKPKEQIEGKMPGETKQDFFDANTWGVPDEVYELPLSEGNAEVYSYKTKPTGTKVCFLNEEIIFIEVTRDYQGTTSREVSIGGSLDKVYQVYGQPQHIFWCVGREVLMYPFIGIGFEIEKDKVRGWFVFEK